MKNRNPTRRAAVAAEAAGPKTGRKAYLIVALLAAAAAFHALTMYRDHEQLSYFRNQASECANQLAVAGQDAAMLRERLGRAGYDDAFQSAWDSRYPGGAMGSGATGGSASLPQLWDNLMSYVVQVICVREGSDDYKSGSGTVVDPSGLVLTGRHVLHGGEKGDFRYCGIAITDQSGQKPNVLYMSEAVFEDSESDLALLKIIDCVDGRSLPESFSALDFQRQAADADRLTPGNAVFVVGYPISGSGTMTLTDGVISGFVGDDFLKTNAMIDSGASGGLAVLADGSVAGVPISATAGDIGGSIGHIIGPAVVDRFLEGYFSSIAGSPGE